MPVKYKKATAPLDETARERLWATVPIDQTATEAPTELAELVDSFYEGRGDEGDNWVIGFGSAARDCREMLDAVMSDSGEDFMGERIRVAVEDAVKAIGSGMDEVKGRVMGWLRDKGYDAGLCKSQRDQTSRTNNHDYIDILTHNRARYIIEINLSSEFEIARPTQKYSTLLKSIPKVFVAKPEVLKKVIDIMCVAAKESIKSAGMHIPPWRTKGYMYEKWFGLYERDITKRMESTRDEKSAGIFINGGRFCRMDIDGWRGRGRGRRDGKLAVAFRGM